MKVKTWDAWFVFYSCDIIYPNKIQRIIKGLRKKVF